MTDFGDFEEDDAFDTAPADPEQVARRYAKYSGVDWDSADLAERTQRIVLAGLLLAWLRRQGHLR